MSNAIKRKNANHEQLDPQPKFRIVRQDRIECDPDRHSLVFNDGRVAKVQNYSLFGVAIETDFKPEENYSDVQFQVDGYHISQVGIAAVRFQKSESGTWLTGFSIAGDPLDVEAAQSVKHLNEILEINSKEMKKDNTLREQFRLKVLEIKDILTRLQNQVNSLEQASFSTDLNSLTHYEDCIATRVSGYFGDLLGPIYQQLKATVAEVPPEKLGDYFEFFRRNVGSIMYQSAYAHRAFHKPKGYAGDYEMMNHVYKRELRGETLFAKCLQRYFVDEPAGKAVRNRELYLRRKILTAIERHKPNGPLKILSVASGPAMEIQGLLEHTSVPLEGIQFYLLDQDLDALKHAQRKIMEGARKYKKKININLVNLSIKSVIQNGLPEKGFHLIYSAGLFDYFTDPVAVYAATQLFEGLADKGELIIGNFSLNNPNQFAMGLIMDWNLIYRSEKKMDELFGRLGKYVLEQEEQGINLFATMRK